MKCPCLYSEQAPICRGDAEAMRVPAAEHLARFCLTDQYRRCAIFRVFLGTMVAQPSRWRSESPTPCDTSTAGPASGNGHGPKS